MPKPTTFSIWVSTTFFSIVSLMSPSFFHAYVLLWVPQGFAMLLFDAHSCIRSIDLEMRVDWRFINAPEAMMLTYVKTNDIIYLTAAIATGPLSALLINVAMRKSTI